MGIKGVIFDFGNVICSFDNDLFISRIAERCRFSHEKIREMLYIEGHIVDEYESGLISSIEFYEGTRDLLDLNMDIEEFKGSFTDIFTPIDATIDLIKELKSKGYKLGLLSNTNEWDHQYAIKKVDVYPLFDAVTVSYDVGVKKPDKRIFEDCLSKIGIKAEECLYIDDIEENVLKAGDLGMRGVHFQEPLLFFDKLEKLAKQTF